MHRAYPRVNHLDRLLHLVAVEQIARPAGAQHLKSFTPWGNLLPLRTALPKRGSTKCAREDSNP
jgi:hypothetical protein